jgi:hypothetical protein
MIDLATETVVTLTQATNHLPRRRGGKKPHPSTLYRWEKDGLETIQVGGTLCTSVESLQRYCERLSARKQPAGKAPRGACTSARRTNEEVAGRLDEIGLK